MTAYALAFFSIGLVGHAVVEIAARGILRSQRYGDAGDGRDSSHDWKCACSACC